MDVTSGNEGNTGDRQNIVGLEQFRKDKIREEYLSSYEAYLKLLDYSEIISEIEHLISKVKRQKLGFGITGQANLLLEEVSLRAGKDSPELAAQLSNMRETLTRRFQDLSTGPTGI